MAYFIAIGAVILIVVSYGAGVSEGVSREHARFEKALPKHLYEYGIEGTEVDLSTWTPEQMFDAIEESMEIKSRI